MTASHTACSTVKPFAQHLVWAHGTANLPEFAKKGKIWPLRTSVGNFCSKNMKKAAARGETLEFKPSTRCTQETIVNARIVISAILLGFAGAGPLLAQPKPPRIPESSKRMPRQCDHARRIAELEADLKWISANVKDPADRNYQEQFIKNKIQIAKNQAIVCGCLKGKLADLSPGNTGLGGGWNSDKATAGDTGPLKQKLERLTGARLSDQQVQQYLQLKSAAFRALPAKVEFELRKKFPQVNVMKPDSFSDEAFVEVLRMTHRYYYVTLRDQMERLKQGPVTLDQTGYFMRFGKRVEAPGLKVLKKKNGDLVHPEVAFYSPELWPILVGEPPAR